MKLHERSKWILGVASLLLGLALMFIAAHVASDDTIATGAKVAVGAASGASGGILTFMVARRLLTSET